MSDETTNATNDVLKQVFDEGHAMGRTAGYTCGHIDGLMYAAREAIDIGGKAKDDNTRVDIEHTFSVNLETYSIEMTCYTCGHIDGLMYAAREAIDIGGKAKDDNTRLAVSNLAERLLSTARELIGQTREVAEGGAK